MAGFVRIPKCCGNCGSLRGGSITIGIIYLVIALLGAAVTVGNDGFLDTNIISPNVTYSTYGVCVENIFLPLLKITSFLSIIANLSLMYGAVSEQSTFVTPWLAWHFAAPIIHIALIIWGIVALVTCETSDDLEFLIIGVLVCSGVTLAFMFYFAVVVYSLHKDLLERSRGILPYGSRTLLPSKNWDEALTPYTNYDSSAATPAAWGTLQPQQETPPVRKAPPPPPPPQPKPKTGIPRPQSQYYA